MKQPISAKTRSHAILICAVTASLHRRQWPLTKLEAAATVGASTDACELVGQAVNFVINHSSWSLVSSEIDAEAEALLQSGWCPGDRVRRR